MADEVDGVAAARKSVENAVRNNYNTSRFRTIGDVIVNTARIIAICDEGDGTVEIQLDNGSRIVTKAQFDTVLDNLY